MQGEADGDAGGARRKKKKRNTDDAPRDGFGAANPSTKRRHTTDTPGHYDDESTSNSPHVDSSGRRFKRQSTSKPPESQLEFQSSLRSSGMSAPQAHRSLKAPNGSDPAAQALAALGASGGHWGAKPSSPGGPVRGQHKLKQSHVPNGPPTSSSTSSSTSSDASSIPAGSTGTFHSSTFKHVPENSSRSLRYGYKPANRAAAGEDSPQSNNNKPSQEAQHHNTRHGATSTRSWQSEGQGNVLPDSRLKGTRGIYELGSSDDGSYVQEDDEDSDANDDENTAVFPTRSQRSTRLGSHSTALLKRSTDDSLIGEHEAKRGPYKTTPSGKKYNQFIDEKGNMAHERSEFNDNLDEKGTLDYVGQRTDSIPGKESIIVSQKPRHPSGLTNGSSALQADKKHIAVEAAAHRAFKKLPGLQLLGSLAPGHAKEDRLSTSPSELDRAMVESKVWAYVAPLVPKSWAASITDDLEKRAFIQAISLPLRNKMDMGWLAGTKNSHQRSYRALMSVIFQAVGVEALCKPCESRFPERQRNCKVLPPEAADMLELQKVCGSKCVNCYFFQASRPCEFPDSPITAKQTPVPVPMPLARRTTSNVEPSFDPPLIARVPPPAAIRPPVPSYSSYKVTKAEKPISESPVPIPSFPTRGPNHQSQSQDTSNISPEKPETKPLRRSGRISKTDGESGSGSSVIDNYGMDETGSRPATSDVSDASDAPDASNDGPSKAAFTSSGSKVKESTADSSNLSYGETSTSQLAGRIFALFGDISRLPADEQAALWNQMQQMSGLLQAGDSRASRGSSTQSISPPPIYSPSAVAGEWEIAPGRLMMEDKPMAYSTSFLSRGAVSLNAAQQLSPTQRVLNKSIAALNQLSLGPEEGWDCTFSVIRGVLKMKVGDVEAKIGRGGVIVVEKKCIITNVTHKEAIIQVWWRERDH